MFYFVIYVGIQISKGVLNVRRLFETSSSNCWISCLQNIYIYLLDLDTFKVILQLFCHRLLWSGVGKSHHLLRARNQDTDCQVNILSQEHTGKKRTCSEVLIVLVQEPWLEFSHCVYVYRTCPSIRQCQTQDPLPSSK